MTAWAKIIGGALGLSLAGPGGLLLGILWGHIFDRSIAQFLKNEQSWRHQSPTAAQKVFFESSFQVMGYVAKLDGRVSEAAIQTAYQIMQRMQLNEAMRSNAIRLFNQGKREDFSLQATLQRLAANNRYERALSQLFIEVQFQIALADGFLSPTKQQVLTHICHVLGFSPWQFAFFEQSFNQTYQQDSHYKRYQKHRHHTAPTPTKLSLQKAYRMLGLDASATTREVKQAYRRLISRYHPDRLASKNLSPEMIKEATEKTRAIQLAYEHICSVRNL